MAEENMLTYKGRPLQRLGNDIYYGNPKDPCVLYMQVLTTKDVNGVAVADKVQVMLLSTDSTKSMKDRVLKVGVRPSLYAALEVGSIWLESALHEKAN